MKVLSLLALFLLFSSHAFSQPKILKKTVFTTNRGTGSKSVLLKMTITGKDEIKLDITQGANTAELEIADLSHSVIRRLILESMTAWSDFSALAGQPLDSIFTRSEIDVIDGLVTETIITNTALNDVQRNDIKAVFRFRDTIPFYHSVRRVGPCNSNPGQQQPGPVLLSLQNFNGVLDSLVRTGGNDELKNLLGRIKRLTTLNDTLRARNTGLSFRLDENTYRKDSASLESTVDAVFIERMSRTVASDSAHRARNRSLIMLNQQEIDRLLARAGSVSPSAVFIFRDTVCTDLFRNVQHGRLYIDSLEIMIKDGFLRVLKFSFADSMEIITNEGIKRVARIQFGFPERVHYTIRIDMRSVSSSEFKLNKFYYLTNTKSKDDYVFNLGHTLRYRPPQDPELIEGFVPQRSRLFFTRDRLDVLTSETDVNKIITLNLFSDIVGIEENKPNGLIQAEAKFFGSWQRSGRPPKRPRTGNISAFNYFEINFILSKIENKEKFLELLTHQTATDSFSYIHGFNLMQYQNLEFGAKFNIARFANDVHEGHLGFGIGTIRTGVRDSLVQSLTASETIITPRDINLWTVKYSLHGMYRLKAISRVGIDLSISLTGLRLLSEKTKQSAGTYDDIDIANNQFKEYSFKKNLIATYQAQIYYFANRDESQRLYARLALNKDIGARGNRFPVIQLGYSADINKFLQFK